ncbi:MAG: DUF997 family protein [Planctomycetia bacterium]|nr:DUF997 family protein [Planctomycetia bacterium]
MKHPNEDPVVTSSRREAIWTLLIWCTALVYSVSYCYRYGYNRPLDKSLAGMKFYFGWPDWVFWGIVVPWLTCVVVSALFAFVFMRDGKLADDLDVDAEEELN